MARRRTAGFTLAELLVVMAIIAVLVAILFPVLREGKMLAQRTRCGSGLRQIGFALLMYLDDNGGKYPLVRAGDKPPDATYWSVDRKRNAGFSIAGLAVAIYPYCKNVDIFMCPSGPKDNDPEWFFDIVVGVKCPWTPVIWTNLMSFPLNRHDPDNSRHPNNCSPDCAQGRTPVEYYQRSGRVFSKGGVWEAWPDGWNGRLIHDPYYVYPPKPVWCHSGGINILYYDGRVKWVQSDRSPDTM